MAQTRNNRALNKTGKVSPLVEKDEKNQREKPTGSFTMRCHKCFRHVFNRTPQKLKKARSSVERHENKI